MKIRKKYRYDFTGLPCKHCNVILSDKNHSNRSKLIKKLRNKRRPWRICKNCLAIQKKRTRNVLKDRAYSKKYKVKNWQDTLLRGCKKRAKEAGLEFNINKTDINEIYENQKHKCYWFNVDIKFTSKKKDLSKISVDRINNKNGYVRNNIVLASYFANIGRSDTKFYEWKMISKKIINNIKKIYG